MGMRLRGTPLVRRHNMDLLSHAVFPGVVQAPPDGQPIILLADAQTTGGYPCLATVIQADLWKLAQARPGAHLYFVPCSAEDARAALARQVREGQRLRHALRTLTE
jgi:allophanate hydrolase subunit 2